MMLGHSLSDDYTGPRPGDYQAPVVHRSSSAPYRFRPGQLAQLARAHGLHPSGRRFESSRAKFVAEELLLQCRWILLGLSLRYENGIRSDQFFARVSPLPVDPVPPHIGRT